MKQAIDSLLGFARFVVDRWVISSVFRTGRVKSKYYLIVRAISPASVSHSARITVLFLIPHLERNASRNWTRDLTKEIIFLMFDPFLHHFNSLNSSRVFDVDVRMIFFLHVYAIFSWLTFWRDLSRILTLTRCLQWVCHRAS